MAAEYGPIAAGAPGAEMASRTSGRLGDLAAAEATSADANALGGAVDERAYRLQIGLESPWPDVMCVRHRPADNRSFTADFTPLRHDFLVTATARVVTRVRASCIGLTITHGSRRPSIGSIRRPGTNSKV